MDREKEKGRMSKLFDLLYTVNVDRQKKNWKKNT